MLLWHLRRSFNRDRELERDPAIRAFCFLITELSDRLRWGAGPPSALWEKNPFVFRAFKIAVAKLLSNFEPKGKMERPPIESFLKDSEYSKRGYGGILTLPFVKEMAKIWESPEHAANIAVHNTLLDLAGWTSPEAHRRYWTDRAHDDESLRDVAGRLIKDKERTSYGMADVRRSLGIVVKIEKIKRGKKQ